MTIPQFIRSRWDKILLMCILAPVGIGFLLLWETIGMYADTQALATGDSTLFYNLITWAFTLAAGTYVISGHDSSRNQLSTTNPVFLFLLGGFLMLMNLLVPQFHTIPEATASFATHQAFNVILGTGAIGLFLFLCGFQAIITNIVKMKINSWKADASTISRDQLPYQWFFCKILQKPGP